MDNIRFSGKKLFLFLTTIQVLFFSCRGDEQSVSENIMTDTLSGVVDSGQAKVNYSDTSATIENALPDSEYPIEAHIDDKDGFTNVRSAPNKNSEILTTVVEGETFFTQLGYGLNTYWKVKTKDGVVGYIYQNRIGSNNLEYLKFMQELYKEVDSDVAQKQNAPTSSSSSIEEDINGLYDAVGAVILGGTPEDIKKLRQFDKNQSLSCGWCGKRYIAKNGWTHSGEVLGRESGCYSVIGKIFYGKPNYCSKRCCMEDN
ncbi:SH3 domain-containing protein [Aquirufa nivalisilvae]